MGPSLNSLCSHEPSLAPPYEHGSECMRTTVTLNPKLRKASVRAAVEKSKDGLRAAYEEYDRMHDDYFDDEEEDDDDNSFAMPTNLCKIACHECGFVLYMWARYCQGVETIHDRQPGPTCKSGKKMLLSKYVIATCCDCAEALTLCDKCNRFKQMTCSQCKGTLCTSCAFGKFCSTVACVSGKLLCGKCAGTRYDHLFRGDNGDY